MEQHRHLVVNNGLRLSFSAITGGYVRWRASVFFPPRLRPHEGVAGARLDNAKDVLLAQWNTELE